MVLALPEDEAAGPASHGTETCTIAHEPSRQIALAVVGQGGAGGGRPQVIWGHGSGSQRALSAASVASAQSRATATRGFGLTHRGQQEKGTYSKQSASLLQALLLTVTTRSLVSRLGRSQPAAAAAMATATSEQNVNDVHPRPMTTLSRIAATTDPTGECSRPATGNTRSVPPRRPSSRNPWRPRQESNLRPMV